MDENSTELEHWIYGASHEKGYGTKAESRNLNGPLYMRYLDGHFTPVRVEKTANGNTIIDARMIHPATVNDEILLSILGRGVADEYNRPTIANHTIVIPAPLLRSGRLTLQDAETAVVDYDRKNPKAAGRIDPIVVPLRDPTQREVLPSLGLKRLITKPAVDTLVTRLLSDPEARTLILCRESSHQHRNELLYRLVEFFLVGTDVPLFKSISDAPTLSAMNHFRLAISSRGVRADATWTLLDASIDKPSLQPIRGKVPIYSRVAEAFAQ